MAVIHNRHPRPPVSKRTNTLALKKVSLHDQLVEIADRWLKRKGCQVRITDQMRASTLSGEQPDNVGWRDGLSLMIECKTSRGDFLADQKKRFRRTREGMGDWRFYLCPEGVITPEDLPEGWGLLWVKNGKVQEITGVPANTQWWSRKPFEGNKRDETILLTSALRRVAKAGHLDSIYR